MAHLLCRSSATILLAILAAYSRSALSGPQSGGATAAVDWAPRHEVRAGNSGLLFTTLNGDLHGFNEDGSRAWRIPLGEAFIRSSAGEHAISNDSEEIPRLLPALDGGLFLARGDRISYVPSSHVRDMVNMSPFKANAFPGVHITGDRESRARMVRLPVDDSSFKDEIHAAGVNESWQIHEHEGPDSDGMFAEAKHDHQRKAEGNRVLEGRGDDSLVEPAGRGIEVLEDSHQVNWTASDGKKLRVGMTRWRIAAVDDGTDQEHWSLTFNEISSVFPRAEPSEMFLSWRDRVDIRGRSAILRPRQSDSACADDEVDKNCELEAGCLTRPSRSVHEQILTFDSEVVAAFVFNIIGDENGSLGLEAVAQPPPHLAPFLPNGYLPQLPSPGSSQDGDNDLVSKGLIYEEWDKDGNGLLDHEFREMMCPVQKPFGGRLKAWLNASKVRDELPERGNEAQGSMHILTAVGIFALGMVFSGPAKRRTAWLWLHFWGIPPCDEAEMSDTCGLGEVSQVSFREVESVEKYDAAVETSLTQGSQDTGVRRAVTEPELGRCGLTTDASVHRADTEPEVTASPAPRGTKFSLSMTNSHFMTTFKDPKRIGVGGFGSVYESEHQLEGESYAVKLIPINGLGDDEDVRLRWELCEVLNLRRLADTRHVVRYFTCWYEEPQYLPFFVEDLKSGAVSPKVTSPIIAPTADPSKPVEELSNGTSELSNRFRQAGPAVGHDEGANLSDSYLISNLESNTSGDVLFERGSQSMLAGSEIIKHSEPTRHKSCERGMPPQTAFEDDGPRLKAVLLIQMELCRGSTLRSWLDRTERGSSRDGEALELAFARQLMKGIRQIHEMDVVHRDLKPQNIFITQEDVLKIGDFGLSRHEKDRRKKEEGEVGTALYCAPEGGACAMKPADIFSAALIILELLCPTFKTYMERIQVLGAFRDRGELPVHINEYHAEHAELLSMMAHRDPVERPSAQQVHQRLKQMNSQRKLEPTTAAPEFESRTL